MNDDGAEVFQGWTSDLEEDDAMEPLLDAEGNGSEDELIEAPHKRVRCQLDVLVLVAREQAHQLRLKELNQALTDIKKLLVSRRTKFEAGQHGLQAHRARSVECYLRMVVENGQKSIDVSERAAESEGFAPHWGGRLVQS